MSYGVDTGYASLTSDDVITGEAVALDLPPASLGVRMASGLIDMFVIMLVAFVTLLVGMVAVAGRNSALTHIASVASIVVIFLVLPTTIETLSRGRSLGKLATGLRVVRDDGGPIAFTHAFVRALIGVVEIFAFSGAPAFLSAMCSTKGKRLGDFAAGTYVVRDRVRLSLPPPVAMPAGLATWARSADIRALPVPLALATRQLVQRWGTLEPAARAQQADALAGQVSEFVAPAPPTGTPPESFLAAVMASRRERDLARLERDRALAERLSALGTPGR